MQIRHVRSFFLVALLVAAMLIIYIISTQYTPNTSVQRSEELRDFLPTAIRDTPLDEATLGARYYATLHSLDPLFSLGGTDTTELRTNLGKLKKSIANTYAAYTGELSLETFFPTELLTKLSYTEDARRTMLANPTTENTERYHTQLLSTMNEYGADLTLLTAAIMSEGDNDMGFLQGRTTTGFVAEKIAAEQIRVHGSVDKEQSRYACLTTTDGCESLTELRKTLDTTQNTSLPSPTQVPDMVIEHKKIMNQLSRQDPNRQYTTMTGETLEDQPLVAITNAACPIGGNPTFYEVLAQDSYVSHLHASRAYDLVDFYFKDIYAQPPIPGMSPMDVPKDILYQGQPLNYYLCIDYGSDHQRALSVLYVRRALMEHPLSFTPNSLKAAKTLTNLEQRIRGKGSVVSDTDVALFMDTLRSIYASEGVRGLETIAGTKDTEYILALIDTWASQGAWFETVIGMMDYYARPQRFSLAMNAENKIRIPRVFFSHSNMTSLYQFANPTIGKAGESYLSTLVPVLDNEFFLTSYEHSLKKRFPTPQSLVDYYIRSSTYLRSLDLF